MKSKVLRASELVLKLRRIEGRYQLGQPTEGRYQLGQPTELVFDIHDTVKESADMIETLMSIIFDVAKIVYSKEEPTK